MGVAGMRVLYELVGVDSASRAFGSAGRSAEMTDSKLGKLSATLNKVGAAMGAAAVAVGVESTRMAVSFQTAMTKIHTQAGASTAEVSKMSKAILGLGGKVQQTPLDLANALYHLESLGLRGAKAMQALKSASDLAAVGGANLEDTATAIGAAWRSGVKGAQSFGMAASTVNAIIGAGNMQMGDLIGALGTGILPAARTFGVSFKSVGAALALMTDEGVPANDAATRLRMTLSLLGAPTDKAAKLLGTIGLSSTSLATAMRGPQGILGAVELLKEHLDASGLSATKQAQLLSAAFGGGRSSSAILTMINNVATLKMKQDQVNSSMGKFGPAVEAQRKTAQAQFDELKSSIDTIAIKLGDLLLPWVNKAAKALNTTVIPDLQKAAKWLTSPDVKPWTEIFTGLAAAALAANAIHAGLTKAAKAFGLGKVTKLGKPPVQVAARQMSGAADVMLKASQNMLKAAGMEEDATVAGKGKAGAAAAGAEGEGAAVGKTGLLSSLLGKLGDIGLPLYAASKITLPGAGSNVLSSDLKSLGNLFSPSAIMKPGAWDPAIKSFTGNVASKIASGFKAGIASAKSGGMNLVSGFFGGMASKITGLNPKSWIWAHVVKPVIDSTLSLLGIHSPSTVFATIGGEVITGLLNGILAKIDGVGSWLKTHVINPVVNRFGTAKQWLLTAGGDTVLGFLGGIRAKMAGIASWVKGNIVDPVVNWVKHFFGIKSPSTVFHGIGANIVAGLLRGLATTDGEAVAKTIFGTLPKALGSIVSKGLVSLTSLPGSALKALGGLGGKLLSFLGFGGGGGGGANKALAQKIFPWPQSMFPAFDYLETREAGYNLTARNPSSGAYGMAQFINGPSEYYQYGGNPNTPAGQLAAMFNYISQCYGNPLAAAAHERAFNWYAKGTSGAAPGWAWVGERGPELVKFGGGETVVDTVSSRLSGFGRGLGGYAKGTKDALIKLGRELMGRKHHGVLDTEISSLGKRHRQDVLLSKAAGLSAAQHKHYKALAEAALKPLHSLEHKRAAVRAYRAELEGADKTYTATLKAAKAHKLTREAARLEKLLKANEHRIGDVNEWTAGARTFTKTAAAASTSTATAPTLADIAAFVQALSVALPNAAYAAGSYKVPATGPATVHQGEMILPTQFADAVRSALGQSGGSGGQFTGTLVLDSGELLGVVRGEIHQVVEKRDRNLIRLIDAGTGNN